jgi:hypothetical protein
MILNISKEDLEILNELVGYGYNSIADDLPMDKEDINDDDIDPLTPENTGYRYPKDYDRVLKIIKNWIENESSTEGIPAP